MNPATEFHSFIFVLILQVVSRVYWSYPFSAY